MLTHLDYHDLRILQLLQHDARLTNKEIADKIGKSVSPVYERIRRLEQDGYIKQYVAVLDRKKLGKSLTAYTSIQLKDHADLMMKQFEQEVVRLPEVMECYHVSGQFDYLLKILMADTDEYYQFISNKIARISNVNNLQSYFVLHEAKRESAFRITLPDNELRKPRKQKEPVPETIPQIKRKAD